MPEPTRPLGRVDPAAVAAEHAAADEILRALEADDDLPGWVWTRALDTLSHLRDLPDQLAWVSTRYCQALRAVGPAMFRTGGAQQRLGAEPDTLHHDYCGRSPEVAEHRVTRGIVYRAADCPCGRTLVEIVRDYTPD